MNLMVKTIFSILQKGYRIFKEQYQIKRSKSSHNWKLFHFHKKKGEIKFQES